MSLNFARLEEFLEEENDEPETVEQWYDRLLEHELDGTESERDVAVFIRGLRYVMQFCHTAAEELKEIAEKEAAEMGEREEAWQEEKQKLKDEIDELREKLTAPVVVDEPAAAFRAQVDSLQEEIRNLREINRQRDRELADQRDRFDALLARTDTLTKERDSLSYNRSQMEERIRELTRRLSSREEQPTSTDWESRKLRQRNEQAAKLSAQLQAVVAQNDELRAEVERVSRALEDATALLEVATQDLAHRSETIDVLSAARDRLTGENAQLVALLEQSEMKMEERVSALDSTGTQLQNLIEKRDLENQRLKERITNLQFELDEAKMRLRTDHSAEREAELEKLKDELVEATKYARTLFGKTTEGQTEDPHAAMRLRLLQSEKALEEKAKKLEQAEAEAEQALQEKVESDKLNADLASQLQRLREATFGDAASEIKKVETQLKFRDKQIQKLNQMCTMLQIELGRYVEGELPPKKLQEEDKEAAEETVKRYENGKNGAEEEEESSEIMEEDEFDRRNEQEPKFGTSSRGSAKKRPSSEREKQKTKRRREKDVDFDVVETQAVLIANLNQELFQLLKEVEAKDAQLKSAMKTNDEGRIALETCRSQLALAYEELLNQRKKQYESQPQPGDVRMEHDIELEELRHLTEGIRRGGDELSRHFEETSRKLIWERVERARQRRRCLQLETQSKVWEKERLALRKALNELNYQRSKQIHRLHYEMDLNAIELGRLQNQLIHSVPLEEFQKLQDRLRKFATEEFGPPEVPDPTEYHFDVLKTTASEADKEELAAKSEYLQSLVDVLTSQSQQLTAECNRLEEENQELKMFMEDIENESDLKSLLGAMHRRVLDKLRIDEQSKDAEAAELRKLRARERAMAKRRAEWNKERSALIHIVKQLQWTIQRNRNDAAHSLSVEQLARFKEELRELKQRESRLIKEREMLEKRKEEVELRAAQIESKDQAREEIGENFDERRAQQALAAAHLNVAGLSAHNKFLENKIERMSRELEESRREMESLQRVNTELSMVKMDMNLWRSAHEDEEESVPEGRDEIIHGDHRISEPKPRKPKPQRHHPSLPGSEFFLDSEDEVDEEVDTKPKSPNGKKLAEVMVTKSVVFDNSQEYEKKLEHVKETARVCIQSYKDQLDQKDRTVERYKQQVELLQKSLFNAQRAESKDSSEDDANDDTVLKMKREKEKLLEDEIEELKKELRHARRYIVELEKANSELAKVAEDTRERGEPSAVHPTTIVEEEESVDEAIEEEIESPKSPKQLPPKAPPKPSKPEEKSLDPSRSPPGKEEPDEIEWTEKIDPTLPFRNQIRTLKEKIRRLTATNKELVKTCEEIRADALEQIDKRPSRMETDQSEV